jgi:hypothetical protein
VKPAGVVLQLLVLVALVVAAFLCGVTIAVPR